MEQKLPMEEPEIVEPEPIQSWMLTSAILCPEPTMEEEIPNSDFMLISRMIFLLTMETPWNTIPLGNLRGCQHKN
jgi:hypothetical protein